MPTYDYACAENGEVVEVKHRISEELFTWGELCDRAGRDLGVTKSDAPVRRLATGGQIVSSSSLGDAPPCESGGGCPGGSCGF